jgi:hypothetical protein
MKVLQLCADRKMVPPSSIDLVRRLYIDDKSDVMSSLFNYHRLSRLRLTVLVGGCVAKTPLREYPDNLKITKTLVQLVRLSFVFLE